MSDIIAPIIHRNGDTKQRILEQYEAVYRAVGEAMHVLENASPNGRNYYMVPGLFALAQAQHNERVAHLYAVRASLVDEVTQIEESTRR